MWMCVAALSVASLVYCVMRALHNELVRRHKRELDEMANIAQRYSDGWRAELLRVNSAKKQVEELAENNVKVRGMVEGLQINLRRKDQMIRHLESVIEKMKERANVGG